MNEPKTEQTAIGELLGTVAFATVKFESKSIREELQFDKSETEINEIKKDHTIRGDFDFTGVTIIEIATFLTSTTSVLKQFQNNELSGMKETVILDLAQKRQTVSVRTMLDTTKTRTVGEASIEKTIEKMQKAGKSNNDIMAELERKLELLKASK